MTTERTILHVDMDAFYASVEERDDPGLRGRPVVVGGSPTGRGVVAAANYVARRFGVHSAMPAAQARRLCPEAVFLPSRMGHYVAVSREIRTVLARYTPLVEPLSLDEAFLDLTGSARLFGSGSDAGARIRADIREATRLVASVGVAPNKFLAKLASAAAKPDGMRVVEPGAEHDFLDPLPVGRLWGVGRVAERRLHGLGVETVAELRALGRARLIETLGAWGERLWGLAHGVDERPVVPDHAAKSISHETTFERDIRDARALRHWLLGLTEQVARRVRGCGALAESVEVRVRYADFRTVSRSARLAAPSDVTRALWREAVRLLDGQLARRGDPVRLLGMGVTVAAAGSPAQPDLFEEAEAMRQRPVDALVDGIAKRFGPAAVRRGADPRRG